MHSHPTNTVGGQSYIAVVAVVGLLGALVATGLTHDRVAAYRGAVLRRLARIGGAALLLGVAFGTARWAITAYFLVGGVLFSVLGWAPSRSSRSTPT